MTHTILLQLHQLLKNSSDAAYKQPLKLLSGSSIGQHVRHSIEMYQCLLLGYATGSVNYNNRQRCVEIENSTGFAIACLENILQDIQVQDQPVKLVNETETYTSSFRRELFYCDEHAIHHMALIKIGLKELDQYDPGAEFGMAPSTIKYRAECVR